MVISDPAQVGVYTEVLYKAFEVSLRRGSQGLSFKLNDASQRRLDRLMSACREKHGSAHYRKDVLPDTFASMGVFYTGAIVPLSDWKG